MPTGTATDGADVHGVTAADPKGEPCEVEFAYCDDGSGNPVWCRCERFCTPDGDVWVCTPVSSTV